MIAGLVADRQDVIAMAKENIKKNHGIDLTDKELDRVINSIGKYIKSQLEDIEQDYISVALPHIGKVYYKLPAVNRFKRIRKNPVWKKKAKFINEHYQSHQSGINCGKYYKFLPMIKGMRERAKTAGYEMEELEEIQNSIKL